MPKTCYFEPNILPPDELPSGGDIIRYAKFLSKDRPVSSKFVTNDLGKLHLCTILKAKLNFNIGEFSLLRKCT